MESTIGSERRRGHESAVEQAVMRASRGITCARLRAYFETLLLALFALGGGLIDASSLARPESGHGRWDLRALGLELMALTVTAAVCAAMFKNRLSRDNEMRDR
jgi:hypothetical protein